MAQKRRAAESAGARREQRRRQKGREACRHAQKGRVERRPELAVLAHMAQRGSVKWLLSSTARPQVKSSPDTVSSRVTSFSPPIPPHIILDARSISSRFPLRRTCKNVRELSSGAHRLSTSYRYSTSHLTPSSASGRSVFLILNVVCVNG